MAKKKKSSPTAGPDSPSDNTPPPPPVPKPAPDPKWIWPPFPTPPEGVTIIPFSQFEPKGIKISFDDEPEQDGEGIRTIPLQVKHGLGGSHKQRKKRKKDPLAEISEEERRKMTWDKQWELGEELRTARSLDHYEPLGERFIESTRLFHQGRSWDRPRQELWDQFRLFTGILSGVKRPNPNKKSNYVDDEEGPDGNDSGPDEELSDEDPMDVNVDPVLSDEEAITATTREKEEEERLARIEAAYQQLLNAREERTFFWVQEPEKATKVFLSSHFRDKGLMWSEPNARDMPILLRFYLEFVLRHRLFVEKDINRGYEKALAIAKRAELDLLATFKISRAFPDEWGQACKAFWGQLYYTPFEEAFRNQSWPKAETQEDKPESLKEADQPKLVAAEYDLGERKVKEEATKIVPAGYDCVPDDGTIQEVDDASTAAEISTPVAEEGTTEVDQGLANDGWGPTSEQVFTTDLTEGWRVPKGDGEEEDVWGTFVEPTLFAFIGPSEFPVRRIPIRVERSTRVLVAIVPPEPASSSIVSSRLATLVLQPWPTPDDDPDSLVTSPKLVDFWKDDPTNQALRDDSVKLARGFDHTKDEIRVHVQPEVVTECRLGMGIGAVWVQIGRRADNEDGGSKSTKRKKYPGDDWWYMERLEFVIPSYWIVNDAHLDMTRAGNNPEYVYNDAD